MKQTRCEWAESKNPLMVTYHDKEWGKPIKDDHKLFEFVILEGAQAGLSWNTVLNRRENYRALFKGFDPDKLARLTDKQLDKILKDPGIIRNRLKVYSVRTNARVCLEVQKEFGTFRKYLWDFVGGKPVKNKWKTLSQIPATTPESDALSKDMKKRGFKFVGSTICYAFMQAVGMVDDHTVDCFRYKR